MAIGWLGLLKAVPWSDVVSNAPKIAEGAKSLWGAVSKRVRPGDETGGPQTRPEAEMPLATRVTTLEENQRELRAQLATSSELIRSLADQDAQLIARLDTLRNALRWLVVVVVVLAGAVIVLLTR
jgi:hypothetical protein